MTDDELHGHLDSPTVKAFLEAEAERLRNVPEGDFFCGWCLGKLIKGGCPSCEWIWADLMTESEAQLFYETLERLDAPPRQRDEAERVRLAWKAVEDHRRRAVLKSVP